MKHVSEEDGRKRKFKVAKRGAEPWDFKKCFHGWMD